MPCATAPRARCVQGQMDHLQLKRWGRNDTTFHSATNASHLAGSDQNSRFKWMGDGRSGCNRTLCTANQSYVSRTTAPTSLPCRHAWLRRPIKDSNSFQGHTLRSPYSFSSVLRPSNLSSGSCSWNATVSTSIPR